MFFFNDTATTEIYTLSLHDALPIYPDATQPITNINLTDTLPSGLTFKTGSVSINGSPDASADPTTGISIPTIAASSDATVSFVADVTAAPSGGATDYVNTVRSEEHTSELQSRQYLVCRLLLEKKKTL